MQSAVNKQAFEYEKGQYICHISAAIRPDERQVLEDVIKVIIQHQKEPSSEESRTACNGWKPLVDSSCSSQGDSEIESSSLHVTLLRGHRAIYYHQIRALIECLKVDCQSVQAFNLCLDQLKIFHNAERTKQFLCMTGKANDTSLLGELKQKLRDRVDSFAIKLTSEDETPDTTVHCSLMVREANCVNGALDTVSTVKILDQLCQRSFDEYPICIIDVDSVLVKIGNHNYNLSLTH